MCGWLTDRLLNVLEVFDFPIETREERFFRVASLLEPRWYSPSAKLLFRASLTSRDSLFQIHQKPGLAKLRVAEPYPCRPDFSFFQFFHISSAALPEGIDEFVSPHSPRCHACRTVLFCSAQWFMPFPFNSFVERLRAGGRSLFIKRNYPRNRRLQAGAQQHTH